MVDRLGIGRAGLFAEPAPVALAEIDRIVLDDFFPGLIALALKRNAIGRARPHAHVAGDTFVNMKSQHAAETV